MICWITRAKCQSTCTRLLLCNKFTTTCESDSQMILFQPCWQHCSTATKIARASMRLLVWFVLLLYVQLVWFLIHVALCDEDSFFEVDFICMLVLNFVHFWEFVLIITSLPKSSRETLSTFRKKCRSNFKFIVNLRRELYLRKIQRES